jgi:hypothetical protein
MKRSCSWGVPMTWYHSCRSTEQLHVSNLRALVRQHEVEYVLYKTSALHAIHLRSME